jgi:hypothetical protein
MLSVYPTYQLFKAWTDLYLFPYFSTLKVEAKFSSETSVDFQRTTRHYNPEYGTLNKQVAKLITDV